MSFDGSQYAYNYGFPDGYYSGRHNSVPTTYQNPISSHGSRHGSYTSTVGATLMNCYIPSQMQHPQYMNQHSPNGSSTYSRQRSDSDSSGFDYDDLSPILSMSPPIDHAVNEIGSQYTSYTLQNGNHNQYRHGRPEYGHETSQSRTGRITSDYRTRQDSKEKVYCPHPDCTDEHGVPTRSFSRRADVGRHYKSAHEPTRIDCSYPKCHRKGEDGFTRKDHLTEHLRGFHHADLPKG